MATVLALETTCATGSVAVCNDGGVVSEIVLEEGMKHGRLLIPAVDRVLSDAGIALCGLDAVACSIGPGSYTGTRVGVMTAKSLAFGAGLPTVAVSSMEALAVAAGEAGDVIVPAQDARRDEIYTAVYRINEDGSASALLEDTALSPEEVARIISEYPGCKVVGSGFGRYGDIFSPLMNSGFSFNDELTAPPASAVGMIACGNIGDAVSPLELEAIYMRRDDAPCTFERFMS